MGLNIVIAALGDALLDSHVAALQKDYPKLKFIAVPVNFTSPDYMDAIKKATDHLDIGIVFNNAGFINIDV